MLTPETCFYYLLWKQVVIKVKLDFSTKSSLTGNHSPDTHTRACPPIQRKIRTHIKEYQTRN